MRQGEQWQRIGCRDQRQETGRVLGKSDAGFRVDLHRSGLVNGFDRGRLGPRRRRRSVRSGTKGVWSKSSRGRAEWQLRLGDAVGVQVALEGEDAVRFGRNRTWGSSTAEGEQWLLSEEGVSGRRARWWLGEATRRIPTEGVYDVRRDREGDQTVTANRSRKGTDTSKSTWQRRAQRGIVG